MKNSTNILSKKYYIEVLIEDNLIIFKSKNKIDLY